MTKKKSRDPGPFPLIVIASYTRDKGEWTCNPDTLKVQLVTPSVGSLGNYEHGIYYDLFKLCHDGNEERGREGERKKVEERGYPNRERRERVGVGEQRSERERERGRVGVGDLKYLAQMMLQDTGTDIGHCQNPKGP